MASRHGSHTSSPGSTVNAQTNDMRPLAIAWLSLQRHRHALGSG